MDTNRVVESRPRLWRSRWAAIGAAVAVTLGAGGLVAVNAAPSEPSAVVTIDPSRILDTRTNKGLSGPFVSAVPRNLQVTGARGFGGVVAVPAWATGVLLNVTVASPSAAGFVSIRPGDATGTPSTSSLNFEAGTSALANAVQVRLPTSGQIQIIYDAYGVAGPTAHVLIDVVGYLVPEAGADGDGWGYLTTMYVIDPELCPDDQIRLDLTVWWGEAWHSTGPTNCRFLGPNDWRIPVNAGTPIGDLFDNPPPIGLDHETRNRVEMNIGNAETLVGELSCDFVSPEGPLDGTLYCSTNAWVSWNDVEDGPSVRPATPAEWEQVIDADLFALAGISRWLG